MILNDELKTQLNQYLTLIEKPLSITLSVDVDETSHDMETLINEISVIANKTNLSPMGDNIVIKKEKLPKTPSFKVGENITFAGIPLGHEFTSLVLAILQTGGRAPKIDNNLIESIVSINEELNFTTYVSLSCHNCPDIVQALNTMSVLNPKIKHTMVDGSVFKEEVESKNIMAVPYVELNGEFFHSGRSSLEEILQKVGATKPQKTIDKEYDVLIVGGGPAGASAAIYAARKGIKTGIIAERFGGQVMDTLGIENLIGTKYTEGPKLVASLEEHVKEYGVDIYNFQRATKVEKDEMIKVYTDSDTPIKTKTLIISTGARWRNLGIPGENEFKNKGVAYCPHCDGPLFKDKHVSVVGGGNSGVEAAIDLAGIAKHVTLLEYASELKADKVLQDRLYALPNTTVIKNAQTKEITGTDKVNGISYLDRETNTEKHIPLDGIFVQIGLVPNTDFAKGVLDLNRFGEILVDKAGKTNIEGIFAAGDCTDSPYKQIIISMGSGASAALSSFDYLMRN